MIEKELPDTSSAWDQRPSQWSSRKQIGDRSINQLKKNIFQPQVWHVKQFGSEES